jgi:hypothetical protein
VAVNRALVVVVTAISACSTLPPVVDGGSDGGPVTGGAFDAGQPLPAPSFVHVFEGAFSPGASAVSRVGAVVHFTFIGDEPLDYAIDTASAEVQRGLIHVVEASLGVTLVDRGGLTWKRRDGTLLAPWELAEQATTTLVSETLDTASGTLALRYRDAVGGVTAEKTYSFQLVGKALRIRVVADASVRRRALDGYNGLRLGGTSRMLRPFETNVPYMGSVPVIGFRGAGDAGAFTSALVDWYQSSASDVRPWGPTETDGGLELFYGTENDPNELGELAAPIDETVHVIVSRDVTQLFPRLAHAPSPYRELTAGRLFVTAGAVYPDSWASYGEYFAQLQSLGVDDVMGVVFPWQQYAFNLLDPRSDNASVLGCPLAQMTFSGAYDAGPLGVLQVVDPASRANVEAGHRCFSAMMEQARDAGYLLALYQPPGNQDQQASGRTVMASRTLRRSRSASRTGRPSPCSSQRSTPPTTRASSRATRPARRSWAGTPASTSSARRGTSSAGARKATRCTSTRPPTSRARW